MVHQYPPEFRGGTEACVANLAAAQLAAGWRPVVVCGSDVRLDAGADGSAETVFEDRVEGIEVHRVRRLIGENYSMDARQPRVAEQVLATVAGLAPDVVHLHHTLNLSGDLGARLSAAGHCVVASLHDYTMVCARFFLSRPDGESCRGHFPLPSPRCVECVLPDFPAGREALEIELAARQASAEAEAAAMAAVIVPSRSVSAAWEASGLFRRHRDRGRLHVLPHPVAQDPRGRPAGRSRADGRLVLATWGHLAPAKGVADLMAAVGRTADPNIELKILGAPTDPAHGQTLELAAQELSDQGQQVSFAGAYAAEDIRALRGVADLAVFPSRADETFGLVVAEARALGFPVLVSDRGALPERVGDGGATFPAGDVEALRNLLVALASDPRRLAGWAAAAAPELLTPEQHASEVAAVYAQALTR